VLVNPRERGAIRAQALEKGTGRPRRCSGSEHRALAPLCRSAARQSAGGYRFVIASDRLIGRLGNNRGRGGKEGGRRACRRCLCR